MSKLVAYLAHPVGHGEDRQQNIANVKLWLRALVSATSWAICIPWLPYVEAYGDEEELEYRDRGIADDLAALERCDLIVLVGGDRAQTSQGMKAEAAHARKLGMPVVDLTTLGRLPKHTTIADLATLANLRSENALAAAPRRIVETVNRQELRDLHAARSAVRTCGDWPMAVLDRIIAAAEARP